MVKRRINTFYPSQACYTITEESIDSTVFRKYRQNRYKPELIEDDVFRIIIRLDNVAAEEVKEQKTSSEREQKNIIWFAKIKKVTGAMYDKKTSTWIL